MKKIIMSPIIGLLITVFIYNIFLPVVCFADETDQSGQNTGNVSSSHTTSGVIVSMGDSYSAGEGIQPCRAGPPAPRPQRRGDDGQRSGRPRGHRRPGLRHRPAARAERGIRQGAVTDCSKTLQKQTAGEQLDCPRRSVYS